MRRRRNKTCSDGDLEPMHRTSRFQLHVRRSGSSGLLSCSDWPAELAEPRHQRNCVYQHMGTISGVKASDAFEMLDQVVNFFTYPTMEGHWCSCQHQQVYRRRWRLRCKKVRRLDVSVHSCSWDLRDKVLQLPVLSQVL